MAVQDVASHLMTQVCRREVTTGATGKNQRYCSAIASISLPVKSTACEKQKCMRPSWTFYRIRSTRYRNLPAVQVYCTLPCSAITTAGKVRVLPYYVRSEAAT